MGKGAGLMKSIPGQASARVAAIVFVS